LSGLGGGGRLEGANTLYRKEAKLLPSLSFLSLSFVCVLRASPTPRSSLS
jgi:hypothetical protein